MMLCAGASPCREDTLSFYDPVLYNGKRYMFHMTNGIQGHPFLMESDYEPGAVKIRGRVFEDVLLNYDIYNQELVLKYENLFDAFEYIALSKAWLEEFRIQGKTFVWMQSPVGQGKFFQVIGQDSLKLMVYWEKKLKVSNQTGNTGHYFSEPSKTMYLYRDGKFFKFRNNRNFLDLFSLPGREHIAGYLKENGINLKKSSDEWMLKLLRYIKQIEN
jgi:hypothetical protein